MANITIIEYYVFYLCLSKLMNTVTIIDHVDHDISVTGLQQEMRSTNGENPFRGPVDGVFPCNWHILHTKRLLYPAE